MPTAITQLLQFIGIAAPALALAYVVSVLAAALPLQLLSPSWQLSVCNALLSQAPLALLAIFLVHCGAVADGEDGLFRALCRSWRRLASLAALGFLLLLPLSVHGTAGELARLQRSEGVRMQQAELRSRLLLNAINEARSVADLQARFSAYQGPTLTTADRALPLDVLRPRLREQLKEARSDALASLTRPFRPRRFALLKECLRLLLLALAYGASFAACAQPPDGEATLLERAAAGAHALLRRGSGA